MSLREKGIAMFTIEELIEITGGKLLQGQIDASISSFHFDSRMIEEKSLFIALTEGVRDGHDFIQAAIENGAIGALISHQEFMKEKEISGVSLILVEDTEVALQRIASVYRRQLDIPIIAITGSNGKTTTKDITAHILSYKLHVFKTYKNFNNQLGLPLSLLQISEKHEVAVLELGMNHAGEIDFLARLAKPTISVITNIGDSHIEFFGSRENIAKAKGELLPHTDPSSYILLNQDDKLALSQAKKYAGEVYTFSTKSVATVYATEIQSIEQGTSFNLHLGNNSIACFIPMFGHHNVSNLLPAVFIAYELGFTLNEIADSLLSLTISDMRFQILPGPGKSILINDAYNASPTSINAACETFLTIYPKRKKVIVLGDILELGEVANTLHTEVGLSLKEKECILITVGDKAALISKEAGGKHFATREEAAQELTQYLNQEYAILFKASRGMEFEELIKMINK